MRQTIRPLRRRCSWLAVPCQAAAELQALNLDGEIGESGATIIVQEMCFGGPKACLQSDAPLGNLTIGLDVIACGGELGD
jgi:hypothetical protein